MYLCNRWFGHDEVRARRILNLRQGTFWAGTIQKLASRFHLKRLRRIRVEWVHNASSKFEQLNWPPTTSTGVTLWRRALLREISVTRAPCWPHSNAANFELSHNNNNHHLIHYRPRGFPLMIMPFYRQLTHGWPSKKVSCLIVRQPARNFVVSNN